MNRKGIILAGGTRLQLSKRDRCGTAFAGTRTTTIA